MLIVEAYFGNGATNTIQLDRNITVIKEGNISVNEDSLQKKLEKEQKSNMSTIAIVDFKSGVLNICDNGTYNGRIWSSTESLSGSWSKY